MRLWLAALAAVAVLGGVAYGGWLLLDRALLSEPDPVADPVATLDAYLDAWAVGDHVAMATLVRDPPDTFASMHAQLRDGLDVERLDLTAGDLVEPADGQATAPVTLTLTLADIGEVSWDVDIELLRERGEWGVVWTPPSIHPELVEGLVFDVETSPVDRAPILAADGTELAGEGTVVTFGFEPSAVDDPDEVVEAFEDALPGSGSTAERLLGRGDLVDGWFYPVVTVSEPRADEASPRLREASGILRRTDEGRSLHQDDFALHVVGRVAEATAEQLEELGEPYEVGDEVGQFGLEHEFEADLVGSDLVRVLLRDGVDGPERVVIEEFQEDPSAPLETTLDVAVQSAVENALLGIDEPAAIVVVDAGSGAIRGAASRPLTGFNRAFEGRYPPGSTFKIVTAEALVASGADTDDAVDCPGETVVGGLLVRNSGDRDLGTVSLLEAVAESCNTSFARLGADLGAEPLAEAAERFGFGVEPQVPLAAFGGSFPEPQDTAEIGAASFGQGRVEVSPLHLASVAAAARSGVWHQPYLLVEDGPGESRRLSTGALDGLHPMLRAAVTDGTGTEAEVTGTGSDVHGKTGTAEAPGDIEHAWFAGSWSTLGFAVLVEEGGAGGEVAAPIAARLVEELAALVDPDDPTPARPDPDADEDPDPDTDADDADADDAV